MDTALRIVLFFGFAIYAFRIWWRITDLFTDVSILQADTLDLYRRIDNIENSTVKKPRRTAINLPDPPPVALL